MHSQRIIQRMIALQNLNELAQERITNDILSSGAREISDALGKDKYEEYVALFDSPVAMDTSFHLLTDTQRKLVDLETAEAYYCLYFLAMALKELQDSNFGLNNVRGDSGSVAFNEFDGIVQSRKIFLKQAKNIALNYSGDTGNSNWIAI